jgi:hypothetical protein
VNGKATSGFISLGLGSAVGMLVKVLLSKPRGLAQEAFLNDGNN